MSVVIVPRKGVVIEAAPSPARSSCSVPDGTPRGVTRDG
jgi:hypothetical protein